MSICTILNMSKVQRGHAPLLTRYASVIKDHLSLKTMHTELHGLYIIETANSSKIINCVQSSNSLINTINMIKRIKRRTAHNFIFCQHILRFSL